MKKVEAIVRPEKLNDVLDQLNRHQIYGVTVTQVTGCGRQKGMKQYYRGTEYCINLISKSKLEMVVKDSWVDEIVEVITKTAYTGEVGDGKIFIYDVEQAYRIRTGEKDEDAIT